MVIRVEIRLTGCECLKLESQPRSRPSTFWKFKDFFNMLILSIKKVSCWDLLKLLRLVRFSSSAESLAKNIIILASALSPELPSTKNIYQFEDHLGLQKSSLIGWSHQTLFENTCNVCWGNLNCRTLLLCGSGGFWNWYSALFCTVK